MAGAQDASVFELGLPRRGANFRPLSPLDFLAWCEDVFPARTGVIYGQTRYTYGELGARCRRLASALRRLGVGKGDTVAVMCPNTPPMLEAHYGVPMLGARPERAQHPARRRLDRLHPRARRGQGPADRHRVAPRCVRAAVAHGAEPAARRRHRRPGGRAASGSARSTYEELLAGGDPRLRLGGPDDEWDALSLCYTSGTTGNPKGVVYHHRGAYLNALGNALALGLGRRPSTCGRCRCSTATAGPTPGR